MDKEIIKYVKDSFLQEKDKLFLLKLLEVEGDTDNFYKQFEKLLILEVKNIGTKFKESIKILNDKFKNADEWRKNQEKEIDKETEEELAKIKDGNLAKKSEIWKEYDKKIEALSEEYKNKINEATKKIMLSKLKEAV